MEEITKISTEKWTHLIKENAYMSKALEYLAVIYKRAAENSQPVELRDIADVLEISEINKEVEVIK